jgi:hypothetical protein
VILQFPFTLPVTEKTEAELAEKRKEQEKKLQQMAVKMSAEKNRVVYIEDELR